jgi:hypothetical protein
MANALSIQRVLTAVLYRSRSQRREKITVPIEKSFGHAHHVDCLSII